VVIVGTGFASSFFLAELLRLTRKPQRILVLEAGAHVPHATLLEQRRFPHREAKEFYRNATPKKPWVFSRLAGGGSNCWFGTTPRMLPEDFKLRTLYGVGDDWPVTYDELEPHYSRAEQIMDVSGPQEAMPYPMSAPYPQPPHRLSEPDQALKAAHPQSFFAMPTARARVARSRGACCNNGVCNLCPVNAKFTVENGLPDLYSRPGVEVVHEAEVTELVTAGNQVTHVVYRRGGQEQRVACDLCVLGANGLFNPFILLRSGFTHAELGKGLNEQVGVTVYVTLAGMKNFQGSTVTSGLGFGGLSGAHRRERGGFLFHTANRATNLVFKPGRALSLLELIINIEDLREPTNTVTIDPDNPARPLTRHPAHSAYAQRTLDALPELLPPLLRGLPVENIEVKGLRRTESHIQGTTVMHSDRERGVVDKHGVHHRCRNLVVLGSGNFPTAAPANPTLTIAALSLFSANKLFSA
jgi:choline dehydrogenase-like flavoprotein